METICRQSGPFAVYYTRAKVGDLAISSVRVPTRATSRYFENDKAQFPLRNMVYFYAAIGHSGWEGCISSPVRAAQERM